MAKMTDFNRVRCGDCRSLAAREAHKVYMRGWHARRARRYEVEDAVAARLNAARVAEVGGGVSRGNTCVKDADDHAQEAAILAWAKANGVEW